MNEDYLLKRSGKEVEKLRGWKEIRGTVWVC